MDRGLRRIVTSYGVPAGATEAFVDLVAVMDRLRSPGGCPWDAQQTHETLLAHAIEEVAEVVEAVEDGDRVGLREELGDLLLQVLFHARVAQEHPEDPFDVAEVAAGVAAKLRRRHPHVFGPEPEDGLGATEVHRRWEEIKKAEKGRGSVFDGVPPRLAALARAEKVLGRAEKAGLDVAAVRTSAAGPGEAPGGVGPAGEGGMHPGGAGRDLGDRLLDLVAEARAAGVDPEAALRARVRELEAALRAHEAG